MLESVIKNWAALDTYFRGLLTSSTASQQDVEKHAMAPQDVKDLRCVYSLLRIVA